MDKEVRVRVRVKGDEKGEPEKLRGE